MATKKIGDAFIVIMLLLFIASGFSILIIGLDQSAGFDSTALSNSLQGLEDNLSGVTSAQKSLVEKTDETSDFTIQEVAQQIETRGSDSSGLINILSKNVLTKFFTAVTHAIPGSVYIIGFIITLVIVTMSILFLRFFWGDGKV